MRMTCFANGLHRLGYLTLGLVLFSTLLIAPKAFAQEKDEFDSYKLDFEGAWLYSTPSGSFRGANDPHAIDLQADLHFKGYSSFLGKLDWRFTHKNHLYFEGLAFNSSRQVVLDRTIVFRGQTFDAGLKVGASLRSPLYALGFQHDLIRRRRGHLGIAVQADLFDSHAAINAVGQVGQEEASERASGRLLAPIPVAGPEFRLYLTNSPRVFVDGNIYGMYFFGYGNFMSSQGTLGITVKKHFIVRAGYQLGSRLVITASTSSDRIGITMTQKGPLAGIEIPF